MPIPTPKSEEESNDLLKQAREASAEGWHGREFNSYWALGEYFRQRDDAAKSTEMKWEYTLVSPDHENPGKESLAYFQKRFEDAETDYLKARYGIFLWGLSRNNDQAIVTQDALKRLITKHSTKGWRLDFESDDFLPKHFSELLGLAGQRHDAGALHWLQTNLDRIFTDLEADKTEAYSCFLFRPCILYIHHLDKDFLTALVQRLRQVASRYKDDPGGANTGRQILEIIEGIHKQMRDHKAAQLTREAILQSYIDEGDWFMKNGATNKGMGASNAYRHALEMTAEMQLGKDNPIVQDVTRKINEAMNHIEYHTWEKSAQFNPEEILKPILEHYSSYTGAQILDELCRSGIYDPDLDKAKQDLIQDRQNGIGVFSQFIPVQRVIKNRLASARPAGSNDDHELKQRIVHQLNLTGFRFELLLPRLVKDGKMAIKDFTDALSKQGIIEPNRIPLFEDALNHILIHHNYIAGISVLTPQIEHYMRALIVRAGGTTQKRIKDGSGLQEMPIGDLINHPILIKPFPESIRLAFDVFLNDEEYVGLRHHNAHGLLDATDYSGTRAFMLVYVLLKLMALKPLGNPKTGPNETTPP